MNTYRRADVGQMTERVEIFLDSCRGEFTYSELADRLGSHRRAIGSCMRALGRLGRQDLCARVKMKNR